MNKNYHTKGQKTAKKPLYPPTDSNQIENLLARLKPVTCSNESHKIRDNTLNFIKLNRRASVLIVVLVVALISVTLPQLVHAITSQSIGGYSLSSPAVVSSGSGYTEVYYQDSSNAIYHNWWNGSSWSGPQSLGGCTYNAPAATNMNGGGNVNEVFATGCSHNPTLYHKWWNGRTWSSWRPMPNGGCSEATPAAVSWGPGRTDVFVHSCKRDDGVWHAYWNGHTWSTWEHLKGLRIKYGLAAVTWPGHLEVFAVGVNNHVYHNWWDGSGWSGWKSLSNTTYSTVAAVSSVSGRIDVYLRGAGNQIYHRYYQSGWSPSWYPMGIYSSYGPGVSSPGSGQLDLYYVDSFHAIEHALVSGTTGTTTSGTVPDTGTFNGPAEPLPDHPIFICTKAVINGCAGSWLVVGSGDQTTAGKQGAVLNNVSNGNHVGYFVTDLVYLGCDADCEATRAQYYVDLPSGTSTGDWNYGVPASHPVYPDIPLSFATSDRGLTNYPVGSGGAALVAYYPVYGDASSVQCGAQGYLVQRYFNGDSNGDGSGTLQFYTPPDEYPQFLTLWNSAVNCLGGNGQVGYW